MDIIYEFLQNSHYIQYLILVQFERYLVVLTHASRLLKNSHSWRTGEENR